MGRGVRVRGRVGARVGARGRQRHVRELGSLLVSQVVGGT